jgi:hypothetical protein
MARENGPPIRPAGLGCPSAIDAKRLELGVSGQSFDESLWTIGHGQGEQPRGAGSLFAPSKVRKPKRAATTPVRLMAI